MTATGTYRVPAVLADLLRRPTIEEGLCAGQAPRWDLEVAGETLEQQRDRLTSAAEACLSCPVLSRCRDLTAQLPARVTGVWAGTVRIGRTP